MPVEQALDWPERIQAALATKRNVPSPCVSVCCIDETRGLCTGCLRSRDEIAAWSQASDDYKRGVWRVIEARLKTLPE